MEIFVYGANEKGIHGAGAAKFAKEHHGAIMGRYGYAGNSYGIPTKETPYKTLPLNRIQGHVNTFLQFVEEHPEMTFTLTPIGCGYAGYKPKDIAPMFVRCYIGDYPNIVLPEEFKEYFRETYENPDYNGIST